LSRHGSIIIVDGTIVDEAIVRQLAPISLVVKVAAVVGLSNCFVAISAFGERHGGITGYWLFDRHEAVESLQPSVSVELCGRQRRMLCTSCDLKRRAGSRVAEV
jgi:hypothetical protein